MKVVNPTKLQWQTRDFYEWANSQIQVPVRIVMSSKVLKYQLFKIVSDYQDTQNTKKIVFVG